MSVDICASGRDAFHGSLPLASNPFMAASPEGILWEVGWLKAARAEHCEVRPPESGFHCFYCGGPLKNTPLGFLRCDCGNVFLPAVFEGYQTLIETAGIAARD